MAKPSSGPRVKLRQGTYVGTTRPTSALYPKAVAAFLGVPYAQSTAGENRLRPPRPLPDSSAEFDAKEYGEACPGVNPPPPGLRAGENCLNANVFLPASAAAAAGGSSRLLPVVVYVHGGGFNMGLGAERNMASFVSWAAEDIVGVSFNYRVGPLGFLASPVAPAAGGGREEEDGQEGVLPNLGLRDQQMLFRWVADNIAAFGGDPGNVTVMGLSAGAHSIGHHLIYYSREHRGPAPFHKAILESGAATARSVLHPTHPRNASQYSEFLAAAGVPADTRLEHVPSRLRALPLQTIVEAGRAVWDAHEPTVCWPFQAVVDGDVIPDLPIQSWRRGAVARLPILTGFNTNEGTFFVPPRAETDADFRRFFRRLLPAASAADMDRLAASLYPDPVALNSNHSSNNSKSVGAATKSSSSQEQQQQQQHPAYLDAPVPSGLGSQWRRLDAAYSDYAYICPVLQTAHYMSQLHRVGADDGKQDEGARQRPSRVYVYHFAPLSPPWGAANHADNAPFTTHDLAQLLGSGRRPADDMKPAAAPYPGVAATSAAMHAAYVRFIVSRSGDPNAPLPSSWPSSSAGSGTARRSTEAAATPHWPSFKSPFGGGTLSSPELVAVRSGSAGQDANGGEERGRVIVFGEGNDERVAAMMGQGNTTPRPGTAARVRGLSERELELCRFWWERVELSQGSGTRLVQPLFQSVGAGGVGGGVRCRANL